MAMALVDRALRARELGEEVKAPAQDEEFVLSHSDNVQATGFVEHLKLPHYVDFQAELGLVRRLRAEFDAAADDRLADAGGGGMNAPAYNFAYLDEQTKRMIRRAILKAIAIPGYQVPFASREMPMPYGWGTGGVQVTAAILGPGRRPQGHRPGLRRHHQRGVDPQVLRQDRRRAHHHRHARGDRHPDPPPHSRRRRCGEDQVLVYQVPIPEPLRFLEPRETETRRMHALAEYGLMHVKLYEDIARHGHIATTYAYPVKVDGRYVMDPSPTPKFDNPKMNDCAGAAAVRRRPREAHLCDPALHQRGVARLRRPSVRALPVRCAVRAVRRDRQLPRRGDHRRPRRPHVRVLGHRLLRDARGLADSRPRSAPAQARLAMADRAARRSARRRPTILPAVLALYAQPELDDGEVLPLDAGRARCIARFARYPDYTLYVAEQDGAIVGSFALLVMDNLGHLGAPSGIVEDVVVAPHCRAAASARR